MKKLILAVFLIINTSFSISAQETITLSNGEWPPYLSVKLKHYGVASRIVTEAFELEGVKVKYKFFPWKRAYNMAKTGKVDGSVLWQANPQREKYFHFAGVVLKGVYVFFHLKSYKFDWKTIKDLKGIQIGATSGYTYGDDFDKATKEKRINVQFVPKDKQNLKKLLKGRILIFPVEREVGYDLIHKHFKPEDAKLFTHHPNPVQITNYQLLLSKKSPKSKHALNAFKKGFNRLYKSGKVKRYIDESNKGEYIKQ